MTLRHLKIFVTVCETGSATAAGNKLYIAQPSISLALSELEEYYGVKLFDRISKRLHITEAGKQLLQYARHIIGLFNDMEKEIKNLDTIGILRIGSSITIGNFLLPKYITEFKKTHPHIDVNVIIDNSETIEQHVLSNKVDLALIEGIVHNKNLISYNFHNDELVLICANNHPFAGQKNIEPLQLQQEKLILREVGSAGRELFDSTMLTHNLDIYPAWESTSTQAIVRAVSFNLGVSILPYMLVKDELDSNRISCFHLNKINFKRKFLLIYHRNKFLTNSTKDFIKLCK